MELTKYIEAIKAALREKISSGVATIDAFMTSEGNLHGGSFIVDGERVNLFPGSGEPQGVKVRFSIAVS